ncbi:WAS/WASL-interacting protein family member 1-like [Triticum urartu]|uniref:WAS/WASL-interacting protein family member 1-like n=1 Tax=Triticum urartu TaxID=4572 RepID=UPI002043DF3F|nr:WAS/WASL-interacting protein family member 1-like [Triticum urartu]
MEERSWRRLVGREGVVASELVEADGSCDRRRWVARCGRGWAAAGGALGPGVGGGGRRAGAGGGRRRVARWGQRWAAGGVDSGRLGQRVVREVGNNYSDHSCPYKGPITCSRHFRKRTPEKTTRSRTSRSSLSPDSSSCSPPIRPATRSPPRPGSPPTPSLSPALDRASPLCPAPKRRAAIDPRIRPPRPAPGTRHSHHGQQPCGRSSPSKSPEHRPPRIWPGTGRGRALAPRSTRGSVPQPPSPEIRQRSATPRPLPPNPRIPTAPASASPCALHRRQQELGRHHHADSSRWGTTTAAIWRFTAATSSGSTDAPPLLEPPARTTTTPPSSCCSGVSHREVRPGQPLQFDVTA